jgi:hypothetical protein
MNKVVHRQAPKREPKAQGVRPAGVNMLGNMQGNHVTSEKTSSYTGEKLYGGKGYATPVGPTNNVAAVGVGGGRQTMHSGQQGLHGRPASGSPPPQQDFSDFGYRKN